MNSATRQRPNKAVLIILALVVVLGAVLRFYGLGRQSLWNDELSHWYRARFPSLLTVIHKCAGEDVHPPGGHIALYFVERYVGDSEVALRFPSAVCGVLAIAAMFLVGSRLYSHHEGLMAAAFMAVLSCPIYYSQEARTYSAVILFALLTTYWWLAIAKALREGARPPWGASVGYVVSAIIACYLHYYGLYLVALQGVGLALLLVRKPRALVAVFLVYLPVVLAYVPWMPTLWRHLHEGPVYIGPPKSNAFVQFLLFLFNGSINLTLGILGLLLAVFLYNLVVEGKAEALANLRARFGFSDAVVVAWLVVPFAGAFLKSLASVPVLTNRNLLISLPAAYLLLARVITRVSNRAAGRAIVTSILVGVFLFHLVFLKRYYSRPIKEQFREAVAYIIERDHLYRPSLIVGCAWNPDYFNYYFDRLGSERRVRVCIGRKGQEERMARLLAKRQPRYLWYIRGHRRPDPEFLEFLEGTLTLKAHEAFVHADVWLFERKQTDDSNERGANGVDAAHAAEVGNPPETGHSHVR